MLKNGSAVFTFVCIIGISVQLGTASSRIDRFDTPGKSVEKVTELPSTPIKRISLDKYQVDKGIVNTGQTLSTILKPYGVTKASIRRVCEMAEGVFDIRGIKTGRPYSVVRNPEQRLAVKYFIYENTPEEFIVFEFGKSPGVFMEKRTMGKENQQISGMVSSTLWESMKDQGASADLILKFEELLGLKVNLNELKPKDFFEVLFEEYRDENGLVRIGNILSARLVSGGKQIAVYQYNHHGVTDYYDKEGNNINPSFLSSPLKYDRVTSGFSSKRKHPITKEIQSHPAIDYSAPAGTPVMSVGDGIVEEAGYSATAGNYIKINHPDSFTSQYLHLRSFAGGVKTGSKVLKGDIIGFVGSTGAATGKHLDFRFSQNGRPVNYLTVKLPESQPVDEACKDDFNENVQQMITQLEGNNSQANDAS